MSPGDVQYYLETFLIATTRQGGILWLEAGNVAKHLNVQDSPSQQSVWPHGCQL